MEDPPIHPSWKTNAKKSEDTEAGEALLNPVEDLSHQAWLAPSPIDCPRLLFELFANFNKRQLVTLLVVVGIAVFAIDTHIAMSQSLTPKQSDEQPIALTKKLNRSHEQPNLFQHVCIGAPKPYESEPQLFVDIDRVWTKSPKKATHRLSSKIATDQGASFVSELNNHTLVEQALRDLIVFQTPQEQHTEFQCQANTMPDSITTTLEGTSVCYTRSTNTDCVPVNLRDVSGLSLSFGSARWLVRGSIPPPEYTSDVSFFASCSFHDMKLSQSGNLVSSEPIPAIFDHPTFQYIQLPCGELWGSGKSTVYCRKSYDLQQEKKRGALSRDVTADEMPQKDKKRKEKKNAAGATALAPTLKVPVFIAEFVLMENFGHFHVDLLLPLLYRMCHYFASVDYSVPHVQVPLEVFGSDLVSGGAIKFDKNNLIVLPNCPQEDRQFWHVLKKLSHWPIVCWDSLSSYANTSGYQYLHIDTWVVMGQTDRFAIRAAIAPTVSTTERASKHASIYPYIALARHLLGPHAPCSVLHWAREDRGAVNFATAVEALGNSGIVVTTKEAGSLDYDAQNALFRQFDIVLAEYGSSYLPAMFSLRTTRLIVLLPACCYNPEDTIQGLADVMLQGTTYFSLDPADTWDDDHAGIDLEHNYIAEQPGKCRQDCYQLKDEWAQTCQHPIGRSKANVIAMVAHIREQCTFHSELLF